MASSFKVIYSPLAKVCFLNIRNFYECNFGAAEAADRIIGKIVFFIDNTLAHSPFIGRIPDDEYLQKKNFRRITTPDKRYNVYYYADEQAQTVYILKIADGRQSTDRQLFGL